MDPGTTKGPRRTQTSPYVKTSPHPSKSNGPLPYIFGRIWRRLRCTSRTGTKRQMASSSLHLKNVQFPGTKISNSRPRDARNHARSTRMAPGPNFELQTVPGLYRPYRLAILQRTTRPLLSPCPMEYRISRLPHDYRLHQRLP